MARTKALHGTTSLLALALFTSPAHAQVRCARAALPTDRIAPDGLIDGNCDPVSPDTTMSLVGRVVDEAMLPAKNRRLASIAAKKVAELLADGADIAKSLKLTEYGTLGASTGIYALLPDRQSDLQKAAAANGAVWLRHDVAAHAGVGYGTSIPLGPDGFFVRTGVGAGANVRISAERRYDPRLAELAKDAVVNHLTIPMAAIDAESMRPGERVTLTGRGNIAVSGEVGYGASLDTGVPHVRVGVSASSGAAKVLSGDFSTDVRREDDGKVRVTLRKATSDETSASLRLFAGVEIDRDPMEVSVDTGVNVVDAIVEGTSSDLTRRVGREIERALSASFVHRNGVLESDGNLQEYVFDLKRREARKAYEDALRGDFRAAAELAACGDGGVHFEKEVHDRLNQRLAETKFSVSLLRYTVRTNSSDLRRDIRDREGSRAFDIYSFSYDRRGFFGGRASVDVGAVHSMTGRIGEDGKSVHLTYRGQLENRWWTSRGEMKDLVKIGTTMSGHDPRGTAELNRILKSPRSGWHLPRFINYFGKTKMGLDLTISESGISRIAGATEEEMWQAFVAPRREKPMWATPEGRRRIDEYLRHKDDNERAGSYTWERHWSDSYERVRDSIAALKRVGATADESERARALRDAAEAMGNDFTAGAALSLLAGQPGRAVKFGIKNEHVDTTWTDIGADSDIVAVR